MPFILCDYAILPSDAFVLSSMILIAFSAWLFVLLSCGDAYFSWMPSSCAICWNSSDSGKTLQRGEAAVPLDPDSGQKSRIGG